MNEETKHPNIPNVVTEQAKGRCAPAPGSASSGASRGARRQTTYMKNRFVLAFAVANLSLTQAFSQAPAPSSNAVVPWGEPLEGVSVRLRADKTSWASNEMATFKLEVRNQGKREFYTVQSQESGRLEVDGVWYDWTGGFDLKSSWLPPGREYHDIPVSLGINWKARQEWRDKKEAPPPQIPLKLVTGKHTIRYAPEIRDITVKPKPQNNYVPSNPVEIEISSNLKKAAEPSRAANRNQPIHSATNRTSSTAGSDR
jgi:hypothetical protein